MPKHISRPQNHQDEGAHAGVVRGTHAGTSAESERSKRPSEPRMPIAVEEQV